MAPLDVAKLRSLCKYGSEGGQPYGDAIEELKLLATASSPHGKYQCIDAATVAIYKAWAHIDVDTASCGADDLMPILTFIIMRAQIPNIVSHIALVRQLLSAACFSSIEEFELARKRVSDVEAAIEFVGQIDPDIRDADGVIMTLTMLSDRMLAALQLSAQDFVQQHGTTAPLMWMADLLHTASRCNSSAQLFVAKHDANVAEQTQHIVADALAVIGLRLERQTATAADDADLAVIFDHAHPLHVYSQLALAVRKFAS